MDPDVARILDANANRAGEAIRVLEDHARFSLNDADLAQAAKSARHELATALSSLPAMELLAARNTPGDVGTALSTPQEYARTSTEHVASAAFRRAAEALRCLEEYVKLESAPAAAAFERLRYRLYDLEQRMVLTAPRRAALAAARLHVLITADLCRRPWLETAAAALDGGATVLQLREKELSAGELLARTRALTALARPRGALVIVNDRPDLARLAGADGAHVGQDDLTVPDARRVAGSAILIGRSTHSTDQFRAALVDGPDYVAVGPMFASATKPHPTLAGVPLARAAADLWRAGPPSTEPSPRWPAALVAIGGISPANAPELTAAGVHCVAVCQSVIAADDPAAACRAILRAMQ